MPYRTKIYVIFDGDNDIHYYRLLQAWDKNEDIDFEFNDAHELEQCRDSSKEETIKRSLRERLKATKIVLLLIGEHTKNLTKFVKWEVETAIDMELPIICVNLNGNNKMDDLAPQSWLEDYPCIYVPYEKDKIVRAIKSWPDSFIKHRNNGDTASYYYKD